MPQRPATTRTGSHCATNSGHDATVPSPDAPRTTPYTNRFLPLPAFLALALAGSAAAETSPYYIGANQALAYQTNIFSSTTGEIDSGISTTSVIGGFDQPIGRQRVYANGTVGYNYFANDAVRYLNNNSYGLNAGLDWQTVERLSGTVRLAANQSLAFYGAAGAPAITEYPLTHQRGHFYFGRRGHYCLGATLMLQADHRLTTLPSMHPLIEAHRAELLALARRRGVTGVRVFGSMSRGDGCDNSDVDLLVTLAPGTSALALGGLLLDAQELLGRRVDVVTEASLHHALRDRVMASAVPL